LANTGNLSLYERTLFGESKPRTKLKLILASASPRRAEILRNAGFTFDVQPAHVDETMVANEGAEDYVRRLAAVKARVAAQSVDRDSGHAIIIGADTVVVAEGQILGKPVDPDDARRMLRMLSGRDHDVLTGLSFLSIPGGAEEAHVETTRVSFVPLSANDIEEYLLTGEPFDKAGAYGIQGIGGRFIRRIEGCYFNVMGLPISRVWLSLTQMEQKPEENTAAR
jgi:septum formation protein